MKAKVLKKMISDGKTLMPDDIVDVSGWRHVVSLESNRYIKVLKEEPKAVEIKAVEPKVEPVAEVSEEIVQKPKDSKPKTVKK
jgi:hypothetical protein